MAATVAAVAAAVCTMACYFGATRLLVRPITREISDSCCVRCLRLWSSRATTAERPQGAAGAPARPRAGDHRPRTSHPPTAMAG